MHLVAANENFLIAATARPGFPILLHEDMTSCREVNKFLREYLMRGSIGSEKSWGPISRALYDYYSFLEANGLSWHDVDRGEAKTLVAAYRDYCSSEASLARNTIRQRVLYVCEFYAFAHRKGWVSNLPYEWEERSGKGGQGLLEHVDARGRTTIVRSVMPRTHVTLLKFLTKTQVKLFIGAAENHHHRLMARFALQSGLRREEIATFPTAYVFDASKISTRNVRVDLDPQDGTGMKTKGSKERTIFFSRRLMKELNLYLIQRRGERASLSTEVHPQLFLNEYGKPFAQDGKGIHKEFSKIGKKIGIKVYPHLLRHTYATHTLVSLQRQSQGKGRIEPLVFLQRQLGHSSILTTMKYVHLINELADDAVLAYEDELNDWLDGEYMAGLQ